MGKKKIVQLNQIKNNIMAYERQVQEHLNRVDASLNRLYLLVKRGQQKEALEFMENGELKERFNELQSIIKLSSDQRTFTWGSNGRKLMNVPFEEHPYSALAAWFKTDEGMEIFSNIEKRLTE